MIFINGIETSFAFLQMYIGKQVIEGEIKKVLLVVAFNSALAYFFLCAFIYKEKLSNISYFHHEYGASK